MLMQDAITEALECFQSPPPNQSNTCEWVILPLLWSAGYARRDIVSCLADRRKRFPDYTLLTEDPVRRWFLVARAWKVDLRPEDAAAALEYARENGGRWVVVTNGRDWHLYDDEITGSIEGKEVLQATLEDGERFREFLTAIRKESVVSGERDRMAEAERRRREDEMRQAHTARESAERRERLHTVIPIQLLDENSEMLDWMCEVLKCQEGLPGVSPAELVEYFRHALAPPSGPTLEAANSSAGEALFGAISAASDRVVIVAAGLALADYHTHGAFICQPHRSFEPCARLGFYTQGAIAPYVPRIMDQVDNVVLSEQEVRRRPDLVASTRQRLLELIESFRATGQPLPRMGGPAKVVFLTPADSPQTVRLLQPVKNDLTTPDGRPVPLTMSQRYVSFTRLSQNPLTTTDLLRGPVA